MDEITNDYTSEERIFSALSHAAIIVPYLGMIAPLAVWITQREKSSWLRYQALQALIYQSLQFLFILLCSCLTFPLTMTSFFFTYEDPALFMWVIIVLPFLPYLFWGFLILVGLFGGLWCALGKDFQYPWLGKKLKTYLEGSNPEIVTGGKND